MDLPSVGASVFPWLDAEHDIFVCEDCRNGVHCRGFRRCVDVKLLNDDIPPPDSAFPRRTISGLMLSYSDASILPVRQRPYGM